MGAKITFDADVREFICVGPPVNGVIVIDIQVDLYSDGKEDWITDATLSGMNFPITPIGGDAFGSIIIGDSYLITDGWTFRPFEGDHTLQLAGNIGTDDGRELVEDTVGSFRVRVENIVSAIVEIREGLSASLVNAKLDAIDIYMQKVDARQEGSHGVFTGAHPDAGKLVIRNTTEMRRWEAPAWDDEAQTVPYSGTGLPVVGELVEVAWS